MQRVEIRYLHARKCAHLAELRAEVVAVVEDEVVAASHELAVAHLHEDLLRFLLVHRGVAQHDALTVNVGIRI